MPSAIELYDAARMKVNAAEKAVDEHVERLKALVASLERGGASFMVQPIRRPVGSTDQDEEWAVAAPLQQMPTREQIVEALKVLGRANQELFRAYEALSDIEKSYVDIDGDASDRDE